MGEDRDRMRRHVDQRPEGEGSGEGIGSIKLKVQCSGGQWDGVNARLKGWCGGREPGSGEEDSGGEGAVPGENTAGFSLSLSDIMANYQTARTQLR